MTKSQKTAVKRAPVSKRAPVFHMSRVALTADQSAAMRGKLVNPVGDQTVAGWLSGTLSQSDGDMSLIIATAGGIASESLSAMCVAAAILSKSGRTGWQRALAASTGQDESKVSRMIVAGTVIVSGKYPKLDVSQLLSAITTSPKPIREAITSGKSVPLAVAAVRKERAAKAEAAKAARAEAAKATTAPVKGEEAAKPSNMSTLAAILTVATSPDSLARLTTAEAEATVKLLTVALARVTASVAAKQSNPSIARAASKTASK